MEAIEGISIENLNKKMEDHININKNQITYFELKLRDLMDQSENSNENLEPYIRDAKSCLKRVRTLHANRIEFVKTNAIFNMIKDLKRIVSYSDDDPRDKERDDVDGEVVPESDNQ